MRDEYTENEKSMFKPEFGIKSDSTDEDLADWTKPILKTGIKELIWISCVEYESLKSRSKPPKCLKTENQVDENSILETLKEKYENEIKMLKEEHVRKRNEGYRKFVKDFGESKFWVLTSYFAVRSNDRALL